MKIYKLHAIMVVIIFFFLSGTGTAADAAPKDDAYHYMKNGIDDRLFNELWRFNAVDNDSQIMITFLLSDPDNLTSFRKIQVQVVVLQEGRPPLQGSHQSQGYGGDRNSPMFEIDKSGFSSDQSLNPNIKVWGEVLDETTGEPISWDLVYQPAAEPWFSIPLQQHVGHLKGDWMKWLIYMPSANVTGSIVIGNRTHKITGIGYHDHYWGRFALSDPQITWAETSVPTDGFSLTLGEIQGEERNAFLGIKKDGKTIKFSGKQIKLNYTNFAFDNVTAEAYPSGYSVSAENGDYILDLKVMVQKSMPIMVDYPAPMPGFLDFRQYSLLQGTLISKSGEEYSFRQSGFSGFATGRLHPIFGKLVTMSLSANDISLTATNERTNQVKTAKVTSNGFYSVDASYTGDLANPKEPWAADGDRVKLKMFERGSLTNSKVISVNLSKDRQEANF